MAKENKSKLAMEDVLLPIEKQPYEIPTNWCWVKLAPIVKIQTGKKDANYGCENGEYYFFTCASEPIRCADYSYDCKAILLAGNGDISNISIYEGKFEAYQRTYIVESKESILTDYLYYYFKYRWVDYNNDKMFGTAIPYIRLGNLNDFEVPFPPIEEQKRIVEQIGSLFSRLDEAKSKVQEVIDGFEARTASVYSDAFTGKLTTKWRTQNNKPNTWMSKRFDEVANIKSNLVDPAEFSDFPHIAPDNIEKRTGILLEYHTIGEDGVTSGKHRFFPGQILYSKIRPYLSKVVMVDFDGLCSADMYPIEAKENPRYLLYYMLSDEFLEQASSAGSRSVLPKINQKELSALKVRIPTEEEQEEVVNALDCILPMLKQTREKAFQVIEGIDSMKKSILAKAFRGQLGTSNLDDEEVLQFLERIISE